MQKFMLILSSILLISQVWAAHPDVKYINVSGVEYSCHQTSAPQYCPRRVYDVPLGITISLERLSCLDSIKNTDPKLKEQIQECFLNAKLKKFFEDLQLYDVKISCIKENLKACSEYSLTCSDPPCGDLGNFIKELKKRRLLGFDRTDGEDSCNSLLQ